MFELFHPYPAPSFDWCGPNSGVKDQDHKLADHKLACSYMNPYFGIAIILIRFLDSRPNINLSLSSTLNRNRNPYKCHITISFCF